MKKGIGGHEGAGARGRRFSKATGREKGGTKGRTVPSFSRSRMGLVCLALLASG